MRPLKALISKNTIHRAHTSGEWSPAYNFKLDDLKEGYLIHTEGGVCYMYVKVSTAGKLISPNFTLRDDYFFIRYDGKFGMKWNDIVDYKNFPNHTVPLFTVDYVYDKEVNFKDTKELATYLIHEVPEILKKLKAE